jgi:hypothetical protein
MAPNQVGGGGSGGGIVNNKTVDSSLSNTYYSKD